MSESNINSSNDNSKAKANANANGGSSHPQGVGKGKSDDEHKESWMTLQVDKGREWFKQLKAELKKDRLWQHILKCSIATECALIICLIPAVALGYGPAVFLGAIVSVFGHPGRNLGAMLETIVFALVGALVGTGWVTFASYVSDLIYRNNAENAHAFRAIILVVSLLVHGYLRSKIPKIFVGVLLFLLTVIIQMTTPNFQFSAKVATTFLYPFLTGILICTFVNILVFPEFSSGKVAVVTVEGLELALETLKDATDFFVSPTDGVRKTLSKTEGKNGKAKDEDSDKDDDREEEEEGGGEQKEDPLKILLSAREKLRKAVASSKATLKETSFEIGYSCLAPARLHPISSKGLDALVTSTLTLIGACETKHIILGDDNEEKKKEEPAEEEEEKKDDESDMDSIKEKLEVIRPKREAEVADEEFLKHLIERVDEPLTTIRATLQQSITALIACIEFSCDVPITPENQSRKPKGILLKEIDIYANAVEVALVEFDKKTREALHKAAEEASEEEEVEFDILPREEIFLVSSFLLNFRIAAQTTLDMLKEGRDMVEEYDGLKGKKNFHLPDFKSKKWLFSGSAEQSETLDTNARENVSRYQKTAGAGNADQKAATQQKKDGSRTDSKKGSLKKTDKKTDKKTEGGKSKGGKGEKPEAQKSERKGSKEEEEEEEEPESWPTRLRGALADVVDWVVTSPHLHYALKLAIGAMLLSWPAFVPEFSNFFYTYRGLWVIVIYILVFENSVGTSVQVFAYRTVGTITGSLWGYAAWSAGRGNPYVIAVMLYFGFLVAFYIQLNTRYVKAGMVLTISMVVVSTTNIGDLANENAVKAFYKARKKADVSLAAASAYLTVSTQEPRIKGSFSIDKMIYKEIIYVLHQIIDRMENVLQLRLQLGSAVLENYYVYVYKYRRNVAAAITITLYAVHEALTSKLPLPQYFPSARLAQLRMVNRVRQILMESVSTNNNNNENITESQEAEDTAKRILRVEFMSYNASSAALEQVIEWLEELVDLTKLLRGAAEFRVGLLSRPTYREWVRQISIGGGGIGGAPPPSSLPPLSLSSVGEKPEPTKEEEPEQQQQQQQQQHGEGNHHRLAKIISSTRKQDVDTEAGEAGDGIPEPLKRVQSRHRENRAGVRRLSQSGGLPERVDALRRAARGL
ncbi:hypothetical protein TWF192_002089 [Orbilia oligospora]|nr:hypothetical protein TWF192_002089 [Orbilia oligospora]